MDHAAVITRLGAAHIAARLGCHVSRPHRWRADNRIPADRWPEIADLAREAGAPEITLETLAAARRRPAAPEPAPQVAA